jgi:hypothetical protein
MEQPEKRKFEGEDRPIKRVKPLSHKEASNMVKYLCKILSGMTADYESIQPSDREKYIDFVIKYEAMVETLWDLYMNYGPPIKFTIEGLVVSISEPKHKMFMWNKMMNQTEFRPNRLNWTRLCSEMEQYFSFFELLPVEVVDKLLDYFKPMSEDTEALSKISSYLGSIVRSKEAWIPYCANLISNIVASLTVIGRVYIVFGTYMGKITIHKEIQGNHDVSVSFEEHVQPADYDLQATVEKIHDDIESLLGRGLNHSHDGKRKTSWESLSREKLVTMIQQVALQALLTGSYRSDRFNGIVCDFKHTHDDASGKRKYVRSVYERFFNMKDHILNPAIFSSGMMPKTMLRGKIFENDINTPVNMLQFRHCSMITLSNLVHETLSESGRNNWTRHFDADSDSTHEQKIELKSSIGWYNPDTMFILRRAIENSHHITPFLMTTYVTVMQRMENKTRFVDLYEVFAEGFNLPLSIIPEHILLAYMQNPVAFLKE